MKHANSRPRIILSAGGTGGHLFPAQVVAEELKERCDILFVGGKLASSPFFGRKEFSFQEISTAPFAINKLPLLYKGFNESRKIIKEFQPDMVIGFGSFYTFPLLAAAFLHKIPLFLHEQNALPGRVTRLFAPFAKTTAITFPKSLSLLKSRQVIEVDFPLRKKLPSSSAWDYYSLSPEKKTLLIFGGSQGAQAINRLCFEMAPLLAPDIQILHFTGDKKVAEEAAALYQSLGMQHAVKEFEHQMMFAWQVADIALTRAGAATVSELIYWEKPALLIPFPQAKDNHQEWNARHFVEEVQGGELLLQAKAEGRYLQERITILLSEKEERRKNIQKYKEKKKANFSTLILDFFKGS